MKPYFSLEKYGCVEIIFSFYSLHFHIFCLKRLCLNFTLFPRDFSPSGKKLPSTHYIYQKKSAEFLSIYSLDRGRL